MCIPILVCDAVRWYCKQVKDRQLKDIFSNFGQFWQELAHEPQFRWVILKFVNQLRLQKEHTEDILLFVALMYAFHRSN